MLYYSSVRNYSGIIIVILQAEKIVYIIILRLITEQVNM